MKVSTTPVQWTRLLAAEIEQGLVTVRKTANRVTLTLRPDGMFLFGDIEVAQSFAPFLVRIGDALKPASGNVAVVAYIDERAQPPAGDQSTRTLSKSRAAAVVRLLAARAGPIGRYDIDVRDDTAPVKSNLSLANRFGKRCLEIVVPTPSIPN